MDERLRADECCRLLQEFAQILRSESYELYAEGRIRESRKAEKKYLAILEARDILRIRYSL